LLAHAAICLSGQKTNQRNFRGHWERTNLIGFAREGNYAYRANAGQGLRRSGNQHLLLAGRKTTHRPTGHRTHRSKSCPRRKTFAEATKITAEVERAIHDFERLAPLHNKSSLELIEPTRRKFVDAPLYAVFDTAFHRTIPDVAALYAIPADLAEKHGIRRFGFHGTSHRYMLERAAYLLGKQPQEVNLVTMHLESGCSVSAIAKGQSVDNTMGFTPLEGLMMGSRSGDVDPSLIPFLLREEHVEMDAVMNLLNKKSGLLGISGKSLDTRVLMKDYDQDPQVKLAMEMFSYRVVKAVGAYLCALGGADAIVFGGGISENTPLIRERVCSSLRWCGMEMDAEKNRTLIDVEGKLSTGSSPLQALVVLTEEGLQIAHECSQAS
jgi:acetate kinase